VKGKKLKMQNYAPVHNNKHEYIEMNLTKFQYFAGFFSKANVHN